MNQHLREAIDHLHEGVQVVDFDWRYVYVNATAARHAQRPVEALIGRTVQECSPGIESTVLFAASRRVMATRQAEALRMALQLEGATRWLDVRVAPVPSGISIVSIDVTDEQRTSERLRSSEIKVQQLQKLEALGRLAGGVAHDFNNQLTVILGIAELLLERDVLDADSRSDLTELQSAAQRSAMLTKQLLAFGRRQVLRLEPAHLPTIVANTSKMLRRLLNANVHLQLQLSPDTEPVLADTSQLENVLVNLALNGSDAMADGGTLTIATETIELREADVRQRVVMKPGRYSVLLVSDTGCGMDAETQEHIFEPFFTTKGPGEGTGLGLATVYGMVKQMSGFIWVQSEPGAGATFRLYFPAVAADALGESLGYAESHAPGGTESILVVEDEPGVRDYVARTLELEGYRVRTAASAEEARVHLEGAQAPYDLLLCDVVLPGISGPAFVQQAGIRNTAVVFMSGYSAIHVDQNQLTAGFPLLQKPFPRLQLLRVVREAIQGASLSH